MPHSAVSARDLARLILAWHATEGERAARGLGPDAAAEYGSQADRLDSLDLESSADLHRLAGLHVSGAFERFFGAEVPESCWQAVGLDRSRTDLPGRLGAIAQALGDRLESDEELPNADRVQGHRGLPAGWEEEAVPLEPTSVLIPAIGADGAREDMLRSYFETLVVAEPVRELGGCEVMVALNDDVARANERSGFDEVVRAYDPACFGLQLATGKDALATRLLRGDLQVVEVIVGGDAPRADA